MFRRLLSGVRLRFWSVPSHFPHSPKRGLLGLELLEHRLAPGGLLSAQAGPVPDCDLAIVPAPPSDTSPTAEAVQQAVTGIASGAESVVDARPAALDWEAVDWAFTWDHLLDLPGEETSEPTAPRRRLSLASDPPELGTPTGETATTASSAAPIHADLPAFSPRTDAEEWEGAWFSAGIGGPLEGRVVGSERDSLTFSFAPFQGGSREGFAGLQAGPGVAVSGSLLFQLKAGQEDAAESLAALMSERGLHFEATTLPGVYQVLGDQASLESVATQLASHAAVAYVEAPRLAQLDGRFDPPEAARTPNDPSYGNGSLWGLSGTNGIQAPSAWDATTGSTAVTVAVIDTGIDYTHPDLYRNIWINQAEIPSAVRQNLQDLDGDGRITFYDLNDSRNQGAGKITDSNNNGRIDGGDVLSAWSNRVDEDSDGYVDDLIGWDFVNNDNDPFDDHGHGTHVAGTIGATGDDGVGIAGINWRVQLMPLKFLGASGSGTDLGAAASIRFAVDHGARISNNSWSGGGSTTLANAIAYAATKDFGNGQVGHLFVAAAGNEGRNIDASPQYPASYDLANILSVASITSSGSRSSFSNFGPVSVDLAAPGSSIYSTLPGGRYGYMSGTSMATPHAAGVAALVLGQNPGLSAVELSQRLRSTVTPLSNLSGIVGSGGTINASSAVFRAPNLWWNAGGVVTELTASTTEGLAVTRNYRIDGSSASPFVIRYYASFDPFIGGGDDLLIGSETISAAGDLSAGSHPGSGPLLQITRPGRQYILAVLDAEGQLDEPNEADNLYRFGLVNVTGSQTNLWWNAGGVVTALSTTTNDGLAVTRNYRVDGARASTFSIRYYASFDPFIGGGDDLLIGSETISSSSGLSLGSHPGSGPTLRITRPGSQYILAVLDADGQLGESDENDNLYRYGLVNVTRNDPNLSWNPFGVTVAAEATAGQYRVNRNYRIDGTRSSAFTIRYYVSYDPFLSSDDQLAGSETISSSSGLSVGNHAGSGPTLNVTRPGTQYVLAVLDAGGQVNELDENDNLYRLGFVSGPEGPSQLIDDGGEGFWQRGSWGTIGAERGGFAGGGYRYAAHGDGTLQAGWTFTSLTAGTYEIQVTWLPHPNRATNAPFYIFDGQQLLQTVYVNQQSLPSGAGAAGTPFQTLGRFSINSGTLHVILTNWADGAVIADAVRIVRN